MAAAAPLAVGCDPPAGTSSKGLKLSVTCDMFRGEARGIEQCAVRGYPVPGAVHAQGHRGAAVAGVEQFRAQVRPGRPQRIDQPAWVFPAFLFGSGVGGRFGGAAQHAVHEAPGPGLAEDAGRGDGLGNRGVVGNAQVAQLVEADEQQRMDVLVAVAQRMREARVGGAPL